MCTARLLVLGIVFFVCASTGLCHPGAHHSSEFTSTDSVTSGLVAAIESLEDRAWASPFDLNIKVQLAQRTLRLARRTGAHSDYQYAEKAHAAWSDAEPDSADALVGHAYALIGLHKFREAITKARSAARIDPQSTTVRALLADAHASVGNYVEAEAIAIRLISESLSLHTLARLGTIAFELSRYEEARSHFQDAIEAGRLLSADQQEIAWCMTVLSDLELESGNTDESERLCREAIQLDPKSHHAKKRLALLLARRGEIEEAESRLLAVVASNPLPEHRAALAEVLLLHGERHDQIEAARQLRVSEEEMCEQINDGDLGHARELIEFWLSNGGNAERAADLALKELRDVRNDQGAYETAAWALRAAGRHAEAAQHARIALSLAPRRPRTLVRCGVIMHDAGATEVSRTLLASGLAVPSALDPALAAEARGLQLSLDNREQLER